MNKKIMSSLVLCYFFNSFTMSSYSSNMLALPNDIFELIIGTYLLDPKKHAMQLPWNQDLLFTQSLDTNDIVRRPLESYPQGCNIQEQWNTVVNFMVASKIISSNGALKAYVKKLKTYLKDVHNCYKHLREFHGKKNYLSLFDYTNEENGAIRCKKGISLTYTEYCQGIGRYTLQFADNTNKFDLETRHDPLVLVDTYIKNITGAPKEACLPLIKLVSDIVQKWAEENPYNQLPDGNEWSFQLPYYAIKDGFSRSIIQKVWRRVCVKVVLSDTCSLNSDFENRTLLLDIFFLNENRQGFESWQAPFPIELFFELCKLKKA